MMCRRMVMAVVVSTVWFRAGAAPAEPATQAAASRPAASAPAVDPEVEQLLDRLERRGETVSDLKCRVRQAMDGLIVGEKIVKEGSLKYLRGDPAKGENPRFYIHFDKIVQDDFPLKPEWYVFDGRWFIEAKESVKQVIRREVVRPGEKQNVFGVEDSPFPVPFGQKKAEILKNFEARIRPVGPKDPAGTIHLECIPRPGTPREKEYQELHFFIDPKLDLPIRIVAHRKTGTKVSEIHDVTFPGLGPNSINTGIAGSEFDYKPPRDWSVTTETLEPPAPTGGAANP